MFSLYMDYLVKPFCLFYYWYGCVFFILNKLYNKNINFCDTHGTNIFSSSLFVYTYIMLEFFRNFKFFMLKFIKYFFIRFLL